MYYSYKSFIEDLKVLKYKVDLRIGRPDAIIAIARGGLTMAHFLAIAWDLPKLYVLNATSYDINNQRGDLKLYNIPIIPEEDSNILIVDEIVDSGASLMAIDDYFKERYPSTSFTTAVIFQKESADFKADISIRDNSEWIDFFWEVWHK